eukprot:COSAG02_NODE_3525_length_6615_cov_2.025629_9_plen_283_part_01
MAFLMQNRCHPADVRHFCCSGPDHGHEAVARCRSCHALHAVCPLLLFSFFSTATLSECAPCLIVYALRIKLCRYPMWDAGQDDTAAFERRLDAVCNEIGDRGKVMVPKVVPQREPAPAPVPQPEQTSSLAPTPAPAPLPEQTSSHAATSAPASTSASARNDAPSSTSALHLNLSKLALERDELLRQVEHITSQLASIEASTIAPMRQHGNMPSPHLSEAFFLERERERERAAMAAIERQAERERLERAERNERIERERILAAFTVGTCTCGLGATLLAATIWR